MNAIGFTFTVMSVTKHCLWFWFCVCVLAFHRTSFAARRRAVQRCCWQSFLSICPLQITFAVLVTAAANSATAERSFFDSLNRRRLSNFSSPTAVRSHASGCTRLLTARIRVMLRVALAVDTSQCSCHCLLRKTSSSHIRSSRYVMHPWDLWCRWLPLWQTEFVASVRCSVCMDAFNPLAIDGKVSFRYETAKILATATIVLLLQRERFKLYLIIADICRTSDSHALSYRRTSL